jgi:hypothetical protein
METNQFSTVLLMIRSITSITASLKHLWDYLGRKVNARTPKCQNIQELGTALVQGWQQYPQHRLRRLIHGISRRFQELYRMRGGYTRY